jgi:hypothetical protein
MIRIPTTSEDLKGKVCCSEDGRLAVVVARRKFHFGWGWAGIPFDDKGTWGSKNPSVHFNNLLEYYDFLRK